MSLLQRSELKQLLRDAFESTTFEEPETTALAEALQAMSPKAAFSQPRIAKAFGSQAQPSGPGDQDLRMFDTPPSLFDRALDDGLTALWRIMGRNESIYRDAFCALPGDCVQLSLRLTRSDMPASQATKSSFVVAYDLRFV